jgi:hypothetical protein
MRPDLSGVATIRHFLPAVVFLGGVAVVAVDAGFGFVVAALGVALADALAAGAVSS